jgi:hypothetical protein
MPKQVTQVLAVGAWTCPLAASFNTAEAAGNSGGVVCGVGIGLNHLTNPNFFCAGFAAAGAAGAGASHRLT